MGVQPNYPDKTGFINSVNNYIKSTNTTSNISGKYLNWLFNSLANLIPEAEGLPYKSYTVLITQSGTNAPTVVIQDNTLGETPTLGRAGSGQYTLTSPGGLFLDGKTFLYIQQGLFNGYAAELQRVSDSIINIYAGTASLSLTDGRLNSVTMEIRVYD